MASTTIDLDTELSAVNSILGAIGQAPITQLKDPVTGAITNANPEIQFIYNLLKDASIDVQSEGWHFNTESHVEFQVDATTNKVTIPADVVKLDLHDNWRSRTYNFVRRGGFLYDKQTHTDEFPDVEKFVLDVTKIYEFEDLPPVFRRHITYRASRMAATQLVANPQLVQLLQAQEGLSRASLMEYECNQGNHSMFGFPEDTVYTTYQPWRNLPR
tara:strand:- start:400 stop:1044 length:645 start_codon:yes stop_codon:yes gene_type:complete